jgi:hypothetical protein
MRREGRAFLMGVNEITVTRDILKVENASLNCA